MFLAIVSASSQIKNVEVRYPFWEFSFKAGSAQMRDRSVSRMEHTLPQAAGSPRIQGSLRIQNLTACLMDAFFIEEEIEICFVSLLFPTAELSSFPDGVASSEARSEFECRPSLEFSCSSTLLYASVLFPTRKMCSQVKRCVASQLWWYLVK